MSSHLEVVVAAAIAEVLSAGRDVDDAPLAVRLTDAALSAAHDEIIEIIRIGHRSISEVTTAEIDRVHKWAEACQRLTPREQWTAPAQVTAMWLRGSA